MIKSLHIKCRPEEQGLLPHSTGHLLYSAVLNSIEKTNPELSSKIHSTDDKKVSVTPIKGEFRKKDSKRKEVFSDTEYRFFINLINSEGFSELFSDFVLSDQEIDIAGESFTVTGMDTEEISWDDIMEKKTPRELMFNFMSPVCIKYKGSGVTEMFPHREAVFMSLLYSWNRQAPKKFHFDVDLEDLKKKVFEKSFEHSTANTVVTRKNKNRIKEFGFTGRTAYGFKDAPDKLKKKLAILARYAEYSGVGSHTARGLGNTQTEVRY